MLTLLLTRWRFGLTLRRQCERGECLKDVA